MFKKVSKVLAVFLMIVSAVVFTSCGNKNSKGTVKLVYVEWACATASTHVAKAVIEKKFGYKVKVTPVSAAAMWESLASGDSDAMTTAWLPVTHKDYLAGVEGKVEDLGPNFKGAKLGLVVPSYVTINSLNELNANAEKFDNKIIGIDPGAGMMAITEKFVEQKATNFKLVEGSGATMTAALGEAIENKEWIVVTGWAPHWKFGRWDLKILEDQDQFFGQAETINTVVRKDLKEDMPEVYNFLDNFYWESKDISEVMVMNQADGADPVETAKKWVDEHDDMVEKWIK